MMLQEIQKRRVYVSTEHVDFRKSIKGLTAILQESNPEILYNGDMFLFYNEALDKVKVLFWDRNGFVLIYKKLDNCQFNLRRYKHTKELSWQDAEEILGAGMSPPRQITE